MEVWQHGGTPETGDIGALMKLWSLLWEGGWQGWRPPGLAG